MWLVVFGHTLEPALRDPVARAAYLAVYTFHIPAFAFLSGEVSSTLLDAKGIRRIGFAIVIPYLLFQSLYCAFFHRAFGLVTPFWLLWYLVSLAAWRLLLPFFISLRGGLLLSLGMALAAGLIRDIGYPFSLSRTLVFFPAFLLGHQLSGGGFRDRLERPHVRIGAAIYFLGLLAAAWHWRSADVRWLYGSYGYAALGTSGLLGPLFRLGVIAAGIAGTFALFALLPSRPTVLEKLGRHSLTAYLLHGFVIRWGAPSISRVWSTLGTRFAVPVAILSAGVLVGLLSTEWAHVVARPLTDARWMERWLARPTRALPSVQVQPESQEASPR